MFSSLPEGRGPQITPTPGLVLPSISRLPTTQQHLTQREQAHTSVALQSAGCEADVKLENAEPDVTNEGIFPKTGEYLFRSLRKGSSALGERMNRLEKASEPLQSKIGFAKAKFFHVFFIVKYFPLTPKHGHMVIFHTSAQSHFVPVDHLPGSCLFFSRESKESIKL